MVLCMRKSATTLTVTEAARNFAEIVNRAFYRGERFLLTKGGKTVAELIPPPARPMITASDLRRKLKTMPHLGKKEASVFARDLDKARAAIRPPRDDAWESS